MEVFCRKCRLLSNDGQESELYVRFHLPEQDLEYGGFRAVARIDCQFFQKDLNATGEDPAQAFFALPGAVVSYLLGKRRDGYEAFWPETGDLDYSNFWTYVE
ncbi:MAG: hypothetical protein P4L64_17915 [Caulobacteraceae bacterium]|nr:hypothetical protein [Caulobacteraceae bacterium]